MIVLLFVLWILLNGRWTTEVAQIGLILCAALYVFLCRFMDYSPRRDWQALKRVGWMVHYACVLVFEIVKANLDVMHMILTPKYEVEPRLVRVQTSLKTDWARVVLANSITLTPGTITVSLEKNRYVVHCLDRSLAEGISSSQFVSLLHRMEEKK